MSEVKKSFANVVRARLDELGTNAFALEQKLGLPADTIRGVIRADDRQASPRLDRAKIICDALGLELYFGPPQERRSNHEIVERLSLLEKLRAAEDGTKEFMRVPLYGDAAFSAGSGAFNDDVATAHLAFRMSWLRSIGVRPDRCCVVPITGMSMSPILSEGDHALIDLDKNHLENLGIFGFVDIDGSARVKRLEKREDVLLLRSENPAFPTEVRHPEDADRIKIIGRVAWHDHSWPS